MVKNIYACLHVLCAQLLSCVRLFTALWTVAHQAHLPMGFFREETDVSCHVLLQGIFPTQGSNVHLLCLLLCRQILCQLSHKKNVGAGVQVFSHSVVYTTKNSTIP